MSQAGAIFAFHSAWHTPEDLGERQPLIDHAGNTVLLFDGRLDNRADLLRQLDLDTPEGASMSDARLVLRAYRAWGAACCERFLGPFALLVADGAARRVLCARDPLGDRTLCYHFGIEHFVVASEPRALLRHPAVSDRLDEQSVSRYFTVRAPLPGATFFAEVQEIPPGHRLVYRDDRLSLEPYWKAEDLPQLRYRQDGEYVEHFRSLLEASVRCRCRTAGPPAILMSGGLDSTAVAAVAARQLRETDSTARLRTFSWVFDELPEADERRFLHAMSERFELDPHPIRGDGEWPLRDLDSWPVPANAPWQGPYCRLQNAAYAGARESGAAVLLTGEYGDHLYLRQPFWLRDLFAEGRWREAWRALGEEASGRGPASLIRSGPARSAMLRALGWRGRAESPPVWLTPVARRLLGPLSPSSMVDPLAAHAASLETANASRAGVDVRRPYRDRRLIEFFLSIPVHLVYRPGWTKWILRRAMRGLLPEIVRLRRWGSTLLPLTARGLVEREPGTVRAILEAPDALWRRYVRPDWLRQVFPRRLQQGRDGVETVIPWQCICMELWRKSLNLSF